MFFFFILEIICIINIMKSKLGRPLGIHTPIKYFTEEERKAAISKSKSKWIIKKPWHCKDYNRTYT